MNISIGAQITRKLGMLGLGALLLTALAGMIELLHQLLPDLNTLIMYLAPQFFGLGLMLYVILSSREAVEEAKRRERSLLASQERFEYLYVSSPVPYLNLNAQGEIFLVNLAAIRLFETTEPKIIGQSLFDFLHHESDTKLSIIVNQIQNRMALSDVELQLKTMDGQLRWVLLSAFAYGKKKEQLVSLVDITRQKQIDMAKTEFVTLASHQLRTPIASTRWNFELLENAHPDRTPEQAQYYDRVARNLERLTALVNDFLHVSKLELGTFASDEQQLNVADLVRGVVEELEKSISEKNLLIQYRFEPDNLEGEFDPRLLRITLTNLISNAVKYTPNGGTITLSYKKVNNDITFSVQDSGIGIPPEEINKLFSRFYRATNAQQQHVEGTGLGLYIAKQAVAKMNGSISVNSTHNKGSTFMFRLPTT